MSAWYILQAIGVYPEPCSNKYIISSPLFRSLTLRSRRSPVGSSQQPVTILSVSAPNNSHANTYIRSVRVNGGTALTADNYFVDGACFTSGLKNSTYTGVCQMAYVMSPTP